MKSRFYTNIILTVVAFLLSGLLISNCSKSSTGHSDIETVANAQSEPKTTPTMPAQSLTYKIISKSSGSELERNIEELSRDGWKPVGFSQSYDARRYSVEYSVLLTR